MGLHDRDYYRDARSSGVFGAWTPNGLTPVVKWLLIANVVVFLAQIFVVREVHVSPLETIRKYDRELDKLLTKAEEGDQAAREKVKKKYPGLDKFNSPDDMELFFPAQRVSI